MTAQALLDTAEELLAGDRGILAMDESIATCTRRFAAAGIDQGVEGRRGYRELLGAERPTAEEVADATLACLLRAVPAAVPGIAFLSGGQAGELASSRLNAMNVRSRGCAPWALGFSFGRAIQQPTLEIWHGEAANVMAAQQALRHRARCDRMARRGEYGAATERTAA